MASLTIPQALALAVQKHQAGRLTEAVSLYTQVLSAEPNNADALHLLGMVSWQEGDRAKALELIRKAIHISPAAVPYFCTLGNVLKDEGRFEEAIAAYREALRLDPASANIMALLGAIFLSVGKLDDAIESFRNALASAGARGNPQAARWHNDLGVALAQAGRLAESLPMLEAAARLDGNYVDAQANMGVILQRLGRLDEGAAACRRAIEVQPQCADAFNTLGIILTRQGKIADGIAALRNAIALKPSNMDARVNLAQALASLGEMDASIATCQAALQLSPASCALHQVLGCALRDIGNLDGSLAAFDRAIEINPRDPMAHSGRIFTRHFHSGSSQGEQASDQRLWDQRHGLPLRDPRGHHNDPDPDRPLRIGYVSPDFTSHVLALTELPLFGACDRSMFQTWLYSDVANPGEVTQRFRESADRWTEIVGQSDQQVAEQIRSDRIDILVDLTMHMRENRMGLFARKPAPIQVTWAAYPGSTGLSAIDYRLTDPHLDPPGMFDEFYSEQSIRLPETFWCYDPMCQEPHINEPPVFRNEFITFGCLNNFCKVGGGIIGIWARILRAVPNSRLLLLCPQGSHRQRVIQSFTGVGVDGSRIEFVQRVARAEYLRLYHRIDVSLDPLPYNGHITSLDSMWMGVPIVTLVGRTVVGRAGYSQLTNLGLTDLIALDADQYVAIAGNLARDIPRLQALREGLREKMERSPLMAREKFARGFETIYRQIWRRWCAQRSGIPAPLS